MKMVSFGLTLLFFMFFVSSCESIHQCISYKPIEICIDANTTYKKVIIYHEKIRKMYDDTLQARKILGDTVSIIPFTAINKSNKPQVVFGPYYQTENGRFSSTMYPGGIYVEYIDSVNNNIVRVSGERVANSQITIPPKSSAKFIIGVPTKFLRMEKCKYWQIIYIEGLHTANWRFRSVCNKKNATYNGDLYPDYADYLKSNVVKIKF
jgi:hypothetical protein